MTLDAGVRSYPWPNSGTLGYKKASMAGLLPDTFMLSYRVGSMDAWRAYLALKDQNEGEAVLLGGHIVLYPPTNEALVAQGGDSRVFAEHECCR